MPHKFQPNQLRRELLGVSGLNFSDGEDSASRKQMFGSHVGQALVISGSTERRIQTGMEMEYGKYTFSVKMPANGRVLRVLQRYPETLGAETIRFNPQSVVLFERLDNREVGIINLPRYCSQHQYFGFEYVPGPAMSKLRPGMEIEEGEIFLNSPSVTPDGGYKFGRECNVAFMSHPAVSEDGVVVCEDVLPHFSFKTYEHRVVEWGSKRFPLNLYGDENNFKPFPDIGEKLRDDGLLMMLRDYNTRLAPIEQSIHDLRRIDNIFDKGTYVAGPGGRVVDIKIFHDGQVVPFSAIGGVVPLSMDRQPMKYERARRYFYQSIIEEYRRLRREQGKGLRISLEFHRLIIEAYSVIGGPTTNEEQVRKVYRQAPLDEWRVEFVVEYTITPTIGFKVTGCHGDKGVICHIAKPEDMPVDADGNRADFIMDGCSTISRMNIGRMYETFFNATARDCAKRITEKLGLDPTMRVKDLFETIKDIETSRPELIDEVWEHLLGFYKIVSPRMYGWFITGAYALPRAQHLAKIIHDGIYIYFPTDNEPEMLDIVEQLDANYPTTYGPVTYRGTSGKVSKTIDDVRIGSMYIMLLEKIGDDWTAVSSGKLQAFGVLSQVTNADKYSEPTRQQAIRALGEAEIRIYVSYVGPEMTADIMDRNNNPESHKTILENILNAAKPTAIEKVIPRDRNPLGGSKPLLLIKHLAECGGWRFVYHPGHPIKKPKDWKSQQA